MIRISKFADCVSIAKRTSKKRLTSETKKLPKKAKMAIEDVVEDDADDDGDDNAEVFTELLVLLPVATY